jgi:hypothetical protein
MAGQVQPEFEREDASFARYLSNAESHQSSYLGLEETEEGAGIGAEPSYSNVSHQTCQDLDDFNAYLNFTPGDLTAKKQWEELAFQIALKTPQ